MTTIYHESSLIFLAVMSVINRNDMHDTFLKPENNILTRYLKGEGEETRQRQQALTEIEVVSLVGIGSWLPEAESSCPQTSLRQWLCALKALHVISCLLTSLGTFSPLYFLLFLFSVSHTCTYIHELEWVSRSKTDNGYCRKYEIPQKSIQYIVV